MERLELTLRGRIMTTKQKLKDYKRLDKRTKAIMILLEAARTVINQTMEGDGYIEFTSAKHNQLKKEIRIGYSIRHKGE